MKKRFALALAALGCSLLAASDNPDTANRELTDGTIIAPTDYILGSMTRAGNTQACPPGGRLAYGFPLAFTKAVKGRYVRFICMPLEGKGLGGKAANSKKLGWHQS